MAREKIRHLSKVLDFVDRIFSEIPQTELAMKGSNGVAKGP